MFFSGITRVFSGEIAQTTLLKDHLDSRHLPEKIIGTPKHGTCDVIIKVM